MDNDGAILLCGAVVKSAVRDYISALRKLKKHPANTGALHEKAVLEKFFNESFIVGLSGLDEKYLVEKARRIALN